MVPVAGRRVYTACIDLASRPRMRGLLARLLISAEMLGLAGGFIPAFGVTNANVVVGLGLSLVIGLLAAVIPATMASRLKIVDALRRVA